MQWQYHTGACSHIHDAHSELPQAWKWQSHPPDLLHLGVNSPYLECLQVPGRVVDQLHNFILIFFGLPWCSCNLLRVNALLELGQPSGMAKHHHGDWYADSMTDMQTAHEPTEYWWTNATPSVTLVQPGSRKNNIDFARCVTGGSLHLFGLPRHSYSIIPGALWGRSPRQRHQEMLL